MDSGDTTWIIVSTALVLGMSPALAFFEAGMLRSKHSLSIISQAFAGNALLSVMWLLFGYTLCFGPTMNGLIGAPSHLLWFNVRYDQCGPHAKNIPAALFALFQMMFASITPLLMTGSFAERLRWDCFLAFTVLWELFVYYPVCHWIWGGGFLGTWGVKDFAGGIVIHVSAGVGALVVAMKDFHLYHGEFPPSNLPLAGIGTALLWMGWFGFNGGSALQAGNLAVSAVVSTHIAACFSASVWLILSMIHHRPAATGIFNGVLAGLAGITAASGWISTQATIFIGITCGFVSYYGIRLSKARLHIDDALDVHMVHGATGAVGAVLLGVFGRRESEEVSSLDWVDHGEVAYHRLSVLPPGKQGLAEEYSTISEDLQLPMEDEYFRKNTLLIQEDSGTESDKLLNLARQGKGRVGYGL
ncbi:ammonium transporter [Guillardia theta CCMP2712]|uniref:Ammonium transporter n=1 Tax=Guillardia theta (strain CCMP2712) TaxID=905079 RepID=L1JHK1_GUITC|nr:ammonium transporter [Guillardia theta CCMP2712]EKX47580.1 ammonium transporter [Guillardia theta CCMP2712]|eukprot:XP_005834560.1 ammonium transporter [Guillardia theta CCMP2712]